MHNEVGTCLEILPSFIPKVVTASTVYNKLSLAGVAKSNHLQM